MRSLKELPWDKGWAVGSKTAYRLVEHLEKHKPKLILDIGSGLTTVLFAEWARDNQAEVISLEHDQFFYSKTRDLLSEYGLEVDLRLCELVGVPEGMFYKTDLPDNIDFVLIDGPPGSIGRKATLYEVFPHLSNNFTAWLDDSSRSQEKMILDKWQKDLGVKITKIDGFARGVIIS